MPDASITEEAFERLLQWLDADRSRAGERYEEIRRKLITIFACQGGASPEEMADDCIDRVIHKLPEIIDQYTGKPEAYFCGVAKYVALEWKKRERLLEPLPETLALATLDSGEIERYCVCLDECLDKLAKSSRDLALEYYRHKKREKIDHRASLAASLGISANGLRSRAHRIREALEKCVQDCVSRQIRIASC